MNILKRIFGKRKNKDIDEIYALFIERGKRLRNNITSGTPTDWQLFLTVKGVSIGMVSLTYKLDGSSIVFAVGIREEFCESIIDSAKRYLLRGADMELVYSQREENIIGKSFLISPREIVRRK